MSSPLCGGICGDIEVNNTPSSMAENHQYKQHLETDSRHNQEIHSDPIWHVILTKVFQVCDGAFGLSRRMIPDTDRSDISIPSFNNSPCIFGAPHNELAA
ncbi:MAG: hypothetical protein HOL98_04180 [Gammaproteobacteria bacterium]|nr:hypothetical protein [Gammaproteobacteria bacterium]MBT5202632.1 hypothetical protein [Gammaproteobacteria bacterium]MBT5603904.1 hypothetical protein [Gammaproteobacteria bacterium]MBT6244796.1 hypothetical protein [Gammaproteobacteria bacterium]